MSLSKEIPIKAVLLGEAGVGKTCIILRYINDIFSSTNSSTILSTFSTKKVKINLLLIKYLYKKIQQHLSFFFNFLIFLSIFFVLILFISSLFSSSKIAKVFTLFSTIILSKFSKVKIFSPIS